MKLDAFTSVCRLISDADLSVTSALALSVLSEFQKPSMSSLATACKVSTAAVTGIIDRMERLGLVERYRPPEDRRAVYVRLTEAGTRFVQSIVTLEAAL
jgi:DNA-binding MarR family transcriptional regulator